MTKAKLSVEHFPQVEIRIETKEGEMFVGGWKIGRNLAVTSNPVGDGDEWKITHVESGRSISGKRKYTPDGDAQAIVEIEQLNIPWDQLGAEKTKNRKILRPDQLNALRDILNANCITHSLESIAKELLDTDTVTLWDHIHETP